VLVCVCDTDQCLLNPGLGAGAAATGQAAERNVARQQPGHPTPTLCLPAPRHTLSPVLLLLLLLQVYHLIQNRKCVAGGCTRGGCSVGQALVSQLCVC
jgi:hypothetical protein